MGFFSDTMKRLTSNYQKGPGSNLGKLVSIFTTEFEEITRTLEKIERCRDIDQAVGKTLDRIGGNVGQARGGSTDIDYRKLIKTKITANRSPGDIETINEVLEVLMGSAYLGVKETWNLPSYDFEDAALVIQFRGLEELIKKEYEDYINDPIYLDGKYFLSGERLLDGGFSYNPEEMLSKQIETIKQIKQVAKRITAGGVHLYWEIPEPVTSQVSLIHQPRQRLFQGFKTPIIVSHQTTDLIKTRCSSLNQNRLDGLHNLDGAVLLDGKREFAVHQVSIREVSA
ncbi:DUF2612 domain-containing protein [Brevibacillus brevis]|uniref:DUF2612 domain-containing protein n=1 Tax=Brevibacillus brevis TaxID=1393 RepID=UPI00115A1128|nr:DUF2612 domain-containing protein [Lysinibacillus sp. SDF0063]TQR29382.1 hypothetical protein C7Y45_28710 [Lysinibacillus sp. SDF0063]